MESVDVKCEMRHDTSAVMNCSQSVTISSLQPSQSEQEQEQLRVRDDFQLFVNGKTQTRPQNMLPARPDGSTAKEQHSDYD